MVDIQNLCFSYGAKKQLFEKLNLRLDMGHIYGLLGKNGAGKSTLLKNMTGLAFPKSGTCMVNNQNAAKRPVALLADLYFLAEDIYVPPISPILFAQQTGIFYPKFNNADFTAYLQVMDIDPAARMDTLSFGQQKKAMIAFGLATNTSLLIMDEPTNGLDIPSKAQFRKLIASVLTENRCIIISTHQVRDLESLIDTLVVLHNREIMVNRQIDDINEALFFGTTADRPGQNILYEEDGMRGKKTICRNTAMSNSKIDLELLFNAIVSNNQPILEILNQQKK